MNKKAHHEIGFAPYAIIITGLIFIAASGKKLWHKLVKKTK